MRRFPLLWGACFLNKTPLKKVNSKFMPKVFMANKESLFASLHILMRAIHDGPADAGRRLRRYWYRESRCQVRTGWQIQNPRKSAQSASKNWSCVLSLESCVFMIFSMSLCLSGKKECRRSSALYNCRESSTNSPLFMQNKPNLLETQNERKLC